MRTYILASALLSASAVAALSAEREQLIASHVLTLAKRQASTGSSSSYLTDIFGLMTPSCNQGCSLAMQDFTACATLNSQAAIAACACSSQTIGDVRACASCIASDNSTSTRNATEVVDNYNSYVDLCQAEGLASVTGTIQVGASTRSASRVSISTGPVTGPTRRTSDLPTTSVAAESKTTYNPSATSSTSVARVPSLANTGAASSMRAATASTPSASASSTQPTSAAPIVKVATSAVVLVGAVAALLA
ncbi:hypothetical protein OIV83_003776 [Microbotryomycetes sp. JL201]|nr:hypothetical protein OIV83_003776 [Microbotryomycetes sp. JL201]